MSKVISAGILLKSKGLYLLGKAPNSKKWGIPKGKVEKLEKLHEAAIREFYEETALDVSKTDIHLETEPFFNFPVPPNKTVHVFRAEDLNKKYFDFSFECLTYIDGTKKPELEKFYWATADEAINMVVKSQKALFEKVKTYDQIEQKSRSNSLREDSKGSKSR